VVGGATEVLMGGSWLFLDHERRLVNETQSKERDHFFNFQRVALNSWNSPWRLCIQQLDILGIHYYHHHRHHHSSSGLGINLSLTNQYKNTHIK